MKTAHNHLALTCSSIAHLLVSNFLPLSVSYNNVIGRIC